MRQVLVNKASNIKDKSGTVMVLVTEKNLMCNLGEQLELVIPLPEIDAGMMFSTPYELASKCHLLAFKIVGSNVHATYSQATRDFVIEANEPILVVTLVESVKYLQIEPQLKGHTVVLGKNGIANVVPALKPIKRGKK